MPEMHLTVNHMGESGLMESTTPQGGVMTFEGDGEKAGSPMQHVLASAGACALIDIDSILRKKRLTFSDLRVDCIGDRPDHVTPRPFEAIRLVFRVKGDVPAKAFEDAVRLAVDKYCSVGATLKKGVSVTHEAVVDGE
ncbi:MAG: OsmC family protein [Thermoplasmatota archaeon]